MALRCRKLHIFQVSLAFLAGYSVRLIMDIQALSNPPSDPVTCPVLADDVNINEDIHQLIREPYKPKTMYDILRYQYFTNQDIFDNTDFGPTIKLKGSAQLDMKDLLHHVMILFNNGKPKQWKLNKLLNGYRRYDPIRGEEYIIDVQLKSGEETQNHHMNVVKPFSSIQILESAQTVKSPTIHMIVTISGQFDKLVSFLKHYEEIVLKNKEDVHLIIVAFTGKPGIDKNVDKIRNLVQVYTVRYRPMARIQLIFTYKPFSRGQGLDIGAKQIPGEKVIFFCDIDMRFNREFLNRCRQNPKRGRQVYYPIVFAQYDPDIVRNYSPKVSSPNPMAINKYTGHWVDYGYGMMCLYRQDYSAVQGYDLGIKGWGGEDVDIFTKHVKSKLKVIRAMEPGLVHLYHGKNCSTKLDKDQMRMCIDSMAAGLGNAQQLAKKILHNSLK
ncbi:unnamed protein product [Owenia fusiformis]|uniref:Hexosyltransferase n=1 Tax=Owenia fusiformis TaxID=6347 RepID=A0A8J1UEN7_OWEFU|nr:unnamed protein product [Owenia fusiformis]